MIRSAAACLLALSCTFWTNPALADTPSADGIWTTLDAIPAAEQGRPAFIRPGHFQAARLDLTAMNTRLSFAPHEGTPQAAPLRITIPNPDGQFEAFDLVEYLMMEPALAARFPNIHTYLGQGVDNPASNIHCDITEMGFRAQVLSPEGVWAIDPYSHDETSIYTSYYAASLVRTEGWQCFTEADPLPATDSPYLSRATGTTLRTYRMAMAAVPSFTSWYGGTVDGAQAGIVTGINRLNQVYTNELSARFTLVANNTSIIYTTTNPGPYTDGNVGTMLGQNQTNLNSVIGNSNFDIGHVVSAMNTGGVANLRALCSTNNKARGATGVNPPSGDFFWVQYVGHEIGHQFGANHAFNADDSADGNVCLPNRNGSTAYEPGSGSTIMSYSSLCGSNNRLQSVSDPMFNQGAYAEIASHMSGSGGCSANAATGNTPPTVNGGNDRTIPAATPFQMTATASDVDNDSITLSWEERDVGPAQPAIGAGSADNGTSPLFRVFLPTTSLSRSFPRLTNVLSNSTTIGEQMPALNRTLRLRVTARDNRAGGGGVNSDDVNLTVSAGAGPFQVTSPNTSVSWSETQTVTWSVANTNASPVSCANVKISLSTDGGQTFPTVLLESTPNDGSEAVLLPDIATNLARIKVEAVGNVFYDISNASFSITHYPGLALPTDVLATPSTVCPGNSTTLSATVPTGQTVDWYTGGCGTTFVGTGATVVATPTANTTYRARARSLSNGQTSNCATVFVSIATTASITNDPEGGEVAEGANFTFTVQATGSAPLSYQWYRNASPVSDNATTIGSATSSLMLLGVSAAQAGDYTATVTGLCNAVTSAPATLTVTAIPTCGTADFDGDGDIGTDADIEAFFACLAGNCCATCGTADFNADGDIGTDADIEAFFRVLSGGNC